MKVVHFLPDTVCKVSNTTHALLALIISNGVPVAYKHILCKILFFCFYKKKSLYAYMLACVCMCVHVCSCFWNGSLTLYLKEGNSDNSHNWYGKPNRRKQQSQHPYCYWNSGGQSLLTVFIVTLLLIVNNVSQDREHEHLSYLACGCITWKGRTQTFLMTVTDHLMSLGVKSENLQKI